MKEITAENLRSCYRNAPTVGRTGQHSYGPFGENLRTTGSMAKSNPLRFSTKYQDEETGLLYYGYRYYSASTGRWLSADPIEENGGLNFYSFVNNQPVSATDPFGLWLYPGVWPGSPNPPRPSPAPPEPRPTTPTERSFFLTFFTYGPLSRDLLGHYMDATGTPFDLSEAQMVEVGAKVNIKRGDGFNNYVAQLPKSGQVQIASMPLFLEATAPGTLGRFYATINGTLKGCSSNDWQFDGSMTYSDVYDFNNDPSRGGAINGMVGLARWGIPGRPFNITSMSTPISQANKDDEAKWSGTGVRGSDSYYIR